MKSILKLLFLVIIITSCSSEARQPLSYSCFDIVQNKTTGLVGISVGHLKMRRYADRTCKTYRACGRNSAFTAFYYNGASLVGNGSEILLSSVGVFDDKLAPVVKLCRGYSVISRPARSGRRGTGEECQHRGHSDTRRNNCASLAAPHMPSAGSYPGTHPATDT